MVTHLTSLELGYSEKTKEMSKHEKDKLQRKVFLKLAKYCRINKFEKMFKLQDKTIKKHLPAWESKEPKEEELVQDNSRYDFMPQYMHAQGQYY